MTETSMPFALIFLMLALTATQAHAEIYRHVDKDGRVVFTDQPPEGATPVELLPLNTLPAGPRTTPSTANASAPAALKYQRLEIIGVQNGDVLQNPEQPIAVAITTDIPLQPGHTVVFIHNGAELGNGQPTVHIPAIARGSHTLAAEIRDAAGRTLIRSQAVTLQVHRSATPPARINPR